MRARTCLFHSVPPIGAQLLTCMFVQDLTPSINPPKEIDDPTDSKPSDWVDEEMITDPDAKKPAGTAHEWQHYNADEDDDETAACVR